MKCPLCFSPHTIVTNSRSTNKDMAIWRRRKCLKCKETFSTYENSSLDFIIVQKRSGDMKRFQISKLYSSVYNAVVSGKNHDAGDAAKFTSKVIKDIESEILNLRTKTISTKVIIKTVLKVLKEKDKGSYLRYLSYSDYRMKQEKI